MSDDVVEDARPPAMVVSMLSPVLRRVLRSPLGKRIGKLATIDVIGRRTGRTYRVVTGWYELDGRKLVFTPARWRANFADGAPAVVCHQGRVERHVGKLERDHGAVAESLNRVIRAGTSPRTLGLRSPKGHTITADDVRRLDRSQIEFRTAP